MGKEVRVYPPVSVKNLMISLAYIKGKANHSSTFNFMWTFEKMRLKSILFRSKIVWQVLPSNPRAAAGTRRRSVSLLLQCLWEVM